MTLVLLKEVLLWSIAIHYGILVVWFLVFVLAHGWLSRLHSRFFGLSVDTFNALNYAGMAVYKIGILLFILVPWLALNAVEMVKYPSSTGSDSPGSFGVN